MDIVHPATLSSPRAIASLTMYSIVLSPDTSGRRVLHATCTMLQTVPVAEVPLDKLCEVPVKVSSRV
jgi:hypothetical protein